MSVKIDDDGDFAENYASSHSSPQESHVVSDLYDVLQKDDHSVVSLAHEVRDVAGDSTDDDTDIVKWCYAPASIMLTERTSDMDSDPNLGRLFYRATDYTANDYNSFDDKYESEVTIKPLAEAGESGEYLRDYLLKWEVIEAKDTVNVAINSNGEIIPPFVASEDRQDNMEADHQLPTYEEAKERLETLLDDHFGEATEVSGETKEKSDEPSDDDEDHLLSEVNGVGSTVGSDIRDYIVENRVTLDWRDHIDDQSDDWRTTIVTKESARSRLQQVALEMDSDDFSRAMELIEDGETEQAMMAVEQYE